MTVAAMLAECIRTKLRLVFSTSRSSVARLQNSGLTSDARLQAAQRARAALSGFLSTMPTLIAGGQPDVLYYSPRLLGADAILSAVQACAGNPGEAGSLWDNALRASLRGTSGPPHRGGRRRLGRTPDARARGAGGGLEGIIF